MSRVYRMRYTIEGEGPYKVPKATHKTKIQDGISCTDTDYGYADDILLVSILRRPDGAIDSMVMLTSEDGRDPRDPTPGLLREVQALIAHHLEHHSTP